MFNHAPSGYACPFCIVVSGGDNPIPYAVQSDVVLRTGKATAFISSRWWPNNPGHVLVVPDAHVENLYDLTPDLGYGVLDVTRRIALALKAVYGCAGVSTRQHNEPAGNQDVWHYHMHVFPRHEADQLYERHGERRTVSREERTGYAESLRGFLNQTG
jgi:histidine triad (HIT) family protein